MTYSPIEFEAHQLLSETGLSAAELLALPMDEYARITQRPSVRQIAAQAVETEPPGTARQASAQEPPGIPAPTAAGAQGLDVSAMTLDQYAAVRGQLGMGRTRGEGKGIFDSVGSRSDEYTAAVRAQSGRTGWTTGNVVEPPRLERRYVPEEQPPAYRSAADRFATPGNAWQG